MQKLLHLPHCSRARGVWDGEGGQRRSEKKGERWRGKDSEEEEGKKRKVGRRRRRRKGGKEREGETEKGRGERGGGGDYKGTGKEKPLGCMCSYIDSKHLYLGLLRINPLTQKLHMNMWAGGPRSEYQS